MAGVSIREIDLVIFAGATYDYTLPNQASVIKSKLDSESKFHIPCIDVDTTCLSFITGLEIALSSLGDHSHLPSTVYSGRGALSQLISVAVITNSIANNFFILSY